jgi:hypothetical protein
VPLKKAKCKATANCTMLKLKLRNFKKKFNRKIKKQKLKRAELLVEPNQSFRRKAVGKSKEKKQEFAYAKSKGKSEDRWNVILRHGFQSRVG